MRPNSRALVAVAAALWAGCFPLQLADTNSTGNISVTGDETWSSTLAGVGLDRATGTNAPACGTRLFDVVAKFNFEASAHFGFSMSVGTDGHLASFVTGVQAQGTTPKPAITGGYATYQNGTKGDKTNGFNPTGGTVTITRFDAERMVGTFELDGTGVCKGMNSTTSCNTHASGDFDVANVGCVPPL